MIYAMTLDNIRYLMQSIGYFSKEQIHSFFRDAEDEKNIQYYLDRLVGSKYLDVVDQRRVIYKARKAKPLSQDAINSLIRAFWIVANLSSEEVIDVFPASYPTQLGFITKNNIYYDVTICDTHVHAQLAHKRWREWLPEGESDRTHHIALVRNREAGKDLDKYGFSSFCVLDKEHKPNYYQYK